MLAPFSEGKIQYNANAIMVYSRVQLFRPAIFTILLIPG